MTTPIFDPAQARKKILSLEALPTTPSRRLELAALRRALEIAATQPPPKPPRPSTAAGRTASSGRTRVTAEKSDDYDEISEPAKPAREIEKTADGRKKVVVRRVAAQKPEIKDEDREDRERRERTKDMLHLLGLSHRGMS